MLTDALPLVGAALAGACLPWLLRPAPRAALWPWTLSAAAVATAAGSTALGVGLLRAEAALAGSAALPAAFVSGAALGALVLAAPTALMRSAAGQLAGAAAGRPPRPAPSRGSASPAEETSVQPAPRGRPPIAIAALALGLALGCMALAQLGAGLAAALVIVGLAAAGLSTRGLGPAPALGLAAAVGSAALAVASRLILSPFGWVGRPVATIAVLTAVALPVWVLALRGGAAWSGRQRLQWADLAAPGVGLAAAVTWLAPFRALDDNQRIGRLLLIGGDHAAHALMLRATEVSGTVLGASQGSLDITPQYAGYFPGAASVGASFTGLLPDGWGLTTRYLLFTAGLLALLGWLAVSCARLVAGRGGGAGALFAILVSLVFLPAMVVVFSLGSPGHLLATCWLLASFPLILGHFRGSVAAITWLVAASMLLLAAASAITWSLVAPALGLGAVILILERWPWWKANPVLGGALAAIAALFVSAAAWSQRAALGELVDTLGTPGGAYRDLPIALVLLLALIVPAACAACGLGPSAALGAELALLLAGATLLGAWQYAEAGDPGYYAYKLVYTTMAVAWIAVILAGRAATMRVPHVRALQGRPARAMAAVVGTAVGLGLLATAVPAYSDALERLKVPAADAVAACVANVAKEHPGGAVFAYGFGPAADHALAKAAAWGAQSDSTYRIWPDLLAGYPPWLWPWEAVPREVVVIASAETPAVQLDVLVEAAERHGVTVTIVQDCG